MNKSGGRPKAHTTTISAVANGRFASNSEVRPLYPQEQTASARPVWSESANNSLMRRSKRHLYSITSSVRASSIGERLTPECLRNLEIDDQLKFVRKFDRQITRLGTFEDLHDVGSRATKVISEIDALAD